MLQLPPMPREQDRKRWEITGLRYRMMYGEWHADADEAVALAVGTVRRDAWGYADLGANLLKSTAESLATLYYRPSKVHRGRAVGLAATMDAILKDAGHQSVMQTLQRDLMTAREMHLYPEQIATGAIRLHPIWPSMVEAEPGDDPEIPAYFRWLRQRVYGDDPSPRWCWDLWDVRDPQRPVYRIEDSHGESITGLVIPGAPADGLIGADYPARWYLDGVPVVPVATYHAARTGYLYDCKSGQEMVEATKDLAVLWTMFGHAVRNASWPQRYMFNAELRGVGQYGHVIDSARRGVEADPAVVLQLAQAEGTDGTAQIGQWAQGASPMELAQAIGLKERRIVSLAGLNPADVERQSGDPRSGYAMAVNRDTQRESQRRFAPLMERGDVMLMRLIASMAGLPTDGWGISYGALPLSPSERRETREHVFALMDRGLMSPVDAYCELFPGTEPDEAEIKLAQIKAKLAQIEAMSAPEPEPEPDEENDDDMGGTDDE